MKNSVIPKEVSEQVEVVLKEVDKLKEVFQKNNPQLQEETPREEMLHSVFYLDLINKFFKASCNLKAHTEITKEEFICGITNNGKLTFDEAEAGILTAMMVKNIL